MTEHRQLEAEVHAACRAVRLAAGLCQKIQRDLKSNEKADKPDASPVTIADYGLQLLADKIPPRSVWTRSRDDRKAQPGLPSA
ncbi:hypothetical protein WJX84_008532 [Apatococcus fuscideae]|uniref:Uncharacterized protein n=1 Tax=Apatococcus fuscideae TaxID=2026836 RepID=A0AAW1TAK5_9CHLO